MLDLFGNEIPGSRPKTQEEKYREYISSAQWRRVASAAVERAGGKCQRCGISKWTQKLEVHHLTYERFGREMPSDLLVVCRDCHQVEDGIRRKEVNLKNAQSLNDARFHGWCAKVYGEHDIDYIDMDEAYDRYVYWAEQRG